MLVGSTTSGFAEAAVEDLPFSGTQYAYSLRSKTTPATFQHYTDLEKINSYSFTACDLKHGPPLKKCPHLSF
jgi:hypothetical protein